MDPKFPYGQSALVVEEQRLFTNCKATPTTPSQVSAKVRAHTWFMAISQNQAYYVDGVTVSVLETTYSLGNEARENQLVLCLPNGGDSTRPENFSGHRVDLPVPLNALLIPELALLWEPRADRRQALRAHGIRVVEVMYPYTRSMSTHQGHPSTQTNGKRL
ncbi:hypothetical protein TIFTF001_025877 [Ficus carica]|uniref:Uncharacterized protein n=1 Tax=Ficus carica TaxID=3494 RepID=A0AA88DFW0_FICCA|nr:hypothetical protein TIFTF001_025877 [Ficus carica]